MIDFYSRLFGPPPEIKREPGGNQASLNAKKKQDNCNRNHTCGLRFDRSSLPDPLNYYRAKLHALGAAGGEWMKAKCPFHKNGQEKHPSLTVNIRTGAFRCFACDAHGGDVLAFQMQMYGQDFRTAAKSLGAL